MKAINIKDVKVLDGVYLDFDNGPVFLLQTNPDNIMCVGSDDTYRGEYNSLEACLTHPGSLEFARTLKGEKIIL